MNKTTGTLKKGKETFPWMTCTMVATSWLLFLMLGAVPETLIYNRTAISHGELWRLVSGHFVHCDLSHLVWNSAALSILGGMLEQRLGRKLVGVVAVSCLGVSFWLWQGKSDLLYYCGLSGMLNGLLAILLAILWKETKSRIPVIIAVAVVTKVIVELVSGVSLFTELRWSGVPSAHGAGLTAGVVYLFTIVVLRERVSKRLSSAV